MPVKGLLLAVEDGLTAYYPIMKLVGLQYRHGVFPFWNPYEFSGFPIMAAIQWGVFYPPTVILSILFSGPAAYNMNLMLHYALAGFFTFLYAREMGMDKLTAVVAGLVFCLFGYLPAHINYESLVLSGAWLPAILYLGERLLKDPGPRRAAWLGLGISMQFFAGHPQIFFYSLLVLLSYSAFRCFAMERGNKVRFAGYMILALILAAVIASPQTIATMELSRMGARGSRNYGLFSMASFSPRSLLSVIFPLLYKNEGWINTFVSPATVFLAVMAFFPFTLSRDRQSARPASDYAFPAFWAVIAGLGIVLSFGAYLGPVNKILFRLPLYGSFRGSEKHWFEVSFALAMLSAYGLQAITMGRKKITMKYAAVIISAASLLTGLYLLLGGNAVFNNILAFSPVFFISAYALIFLLMKRYPAVKYALLIVIFLEAISYKTIYHFPKSDKVEARNAGLYHFLKSNGDGRTAFITREPSDFMYGMSRGIMSVNGYDALFTYQYAELLNMGIQGFSYEWPQLLQNNLLLSMLNTKYVVAPKGLTVTGPVYKKEYETDGLDVYENLNAMPRAYAVTGLVPVDSIEDFKQRVYALQLDPRRDAGVYMEDLSSIGGASFAAGQVKIQSSSPQKIVIGTDFPGQGFVVLADQYYPGWKACVDGAETNIYRADGLLRGVAVPPGRHVLTFAYRPYKIYAAMLLAALGLVAAVFMMFGKDKKRRDP